MNYFLQDDVQKIFRNRFVVIIGDSIQRGIYKDLCLLLQENRQLKFHELKAKGERSFMRDELIEGGMLGKMCNGIQYKEVRQYCVGTHLVRFYFTTRCYNNYVASILKDLKDGPDPDVVIMNSCLWDMTRYGSKAIVEYKENLVHLFKGLSSSLPESCLVIWNTTLPISNQAKGGFLIPEVQFMTTTLRLDVLEANFYAKQVAVEHGCDVLDLHFYLRHHLHRRIHDGIHWDAEAHRRITNMLLLHICEAWETPLPTHWPSTFKSYGSQASRSGAVMAPRPHRNVTLQPLRSHDPRGGFSFGQGPSRGINGPQRNKPWEEGFISDNISDAASEESETGWSHHNAGYPSHHQQTFDRGGYRGQGGHQLHDFRFGDNVRQNFNAMTTNLLAVQRQIISRCVPSANIPSLLPARGLNWQPYEQSSYTRASTSSVKARYHGQRGQDYESDYRRRKF